MITIKLDSEIDKLLRTVDGFDKRDLPYATTVAANRTADRTLQKIKREIPTHLDRPTPFAVNSLFVRKATKSKPEATIEWRLFSGKGFGMGRPLETQAEGGGRGQKGLEKALAAFGYLPPGWFVIPTKDAPRDPYGNVPGKYVVQVLSYLRADRSGTQARPVRTTTKRQRTRQAKRVSKFFVVLKGSVVGSGQKTKLPSGVYERIASAFGSAYRMVFAFVDSVNYEKKFPIKPIFEAFVRETFPREFAEAMRVSMRTRANFK